MNGFRSRFAVRQARRLVLGFAIGCLCAIALHLFLSDSVFLPMLQQKWSSMPFQRAFDGVGAYKRELLACCAVLGLVLLLVFATKTWRFMRAWWAGITSVTAAVAAAATIIIVNYGEAFSIRTWGASGLAVIATIVTEHWRWHKAPQRSIENAEGLKIDIPRRKVARVSEEDWQASSSDDPIEDWEQDLVGRASVVEARRVGWAGIAGENLRNS